MKTIKLVPLPLLTLKALGAGDLISANHTAPIPLSEYFVRPDCRSTWHRRALQIAKDPRAEEWITRVIVDTDRGMAIGQAGFHGPPDALGMVEVGYAIDPLFRRQGYGRAALAALLSWAMKDETIRRVRASISPENLPSRMIVSSFGFVEVGEQWDDEDGLETIFEVEAC
ncbi:GNAT family N-acetyltransferase [Novosphingobium terrae]|uniref:GNAT family N-acetyltransferase n=1 Tax=Novosphingobium terrae TaxID=2726189 RepID=UPI0019800F45|nr:GNAT family N-acetyltransferase [Novosphingobium terrae]